MEYHFLMLFRDLLLKGAVKKYQFALGYFKLQTK